VMELSCPNSAVHTWRIRYMSSKLHVLILQDHRLQIRICVIKGRSRVRTLL
jgi:hypothetical protein